MGKQPVTKRLIQWIVCLAISAVLLYIMLRDINWAQFQGELFKCNVWILLLIAPLQLLLFWIRTVRFRVLLPSSREVRLRPLFDAMSVGLLANFVLPFRAGEFVRPWFVSRWVGVSYASSFAANVTERVFDIFGIMFLLGISLAQMESAPTLVQLGGKVLGVMAIFVVLVMIVSYLWSAKVVVLVGSILSRFISEETALYSKLMGTAEEFLHGLKAIASLRELVAALFYSILLWLVTAALYHVGILSFGVVPTSMLAGAVVTVMVALAVAAPSAPGFVGTFQAGCFVALVSIYRYTDEFALAYSIVMHVIQLLLCFIIAFFVLQKRGVSITAITSASAEG